jgi:hypothetical protein
VLHGRTWEIEPYLSSTWRPGGGQSNAANEAGGLRGLDAPAFMVVA